MTTEEKTPYHTIMVEAWRIFIKERKATIFSDEWWEEIIGEYEALRKLYKGTNLDNYVCDISMAFLDEYERRRKNANKRGTNQSVTGEH